MSIRPEDPLAYTNFGELISIFDQNWSDFCDTLRSQQLESHNLILVQGTAVSDHLPNLVELRKDGPHRLLS